MEKVGGANFCQCFLKVRGLHVKYPTPTHDPLPGSQEGCKRTLDWPRRGLREGGGVPYIYIHTYVHVCMCVYIYIYIHVCVYTYVFVCVCIAFLFEVLFYFRLDNILGIVVLVPGETQGLAVVYRHGRRLRRQAKFSPQSPPKP